MYGYACEQDSRGTFVWMESGICAAIIVLRRLVAAAEFGIAEHRDPFVNPVSLKPMRERGIILRRALLRNCRISSLRYCGGREPICGSKHVTTYVGVGCYGYTPRTLARRHGAFMPYKPPLCHHNCASSGTAGMVAAKCRIVKHHGVPSANPSARRHVRRGRVLRLIRANVCG